ncbi:MAG: hypothetical protein ACK56I_37345, partial [bacterium]
MELFEFLRHLRREVVGLAEVLVDVVKLPWGFLEIHVAAERFPREPVFAARHPAVVVDRAVRGQFEVLRRPPVLRRGVVERVEHAHAFDRLLQDAVDDLRFGDLAGC